MNKESKFKVFTRMGIPSFARAWYSNFSLSFPAHVQMTPEEGPARRAFVFHNDVYDSNSFAYSILRQPVEINAKCHHIPIAIPKKNGRMDIVADT